MFFLAGLSYRNKLAHLERTRTQELLIKQLNKNKELQRKLNEQLEELVKEQTTEILRKKQELEEQRKKQLETEYDKKLTEIELESHPGPDQSALYFQLPEFHTIVCNAAGLRVCAEISLRFFLPDP